MRVYINGEERVVGPVANIAELVVILGLETRKVAVERNLEIVPRGLHAATPVHEDDRFEIVTFIGGG
jgi:thiamine biosynthesis protein ThiS